MSYRVNTSGLKAIAIVTVIFSLGFLIPFFLDAKEAQDLAESKCSEQITALEQGKTHCLQKNNN